LIKRGEVYWVNLDPTVGSEIKKTRPALIISNDVNNVHAQTVTVLPLTSSVDVVHPFEVLVGPHLCGNKQSSKVKANQIRTVDKRRLGNLLGMFPGALMLQVDEAVRLHLGL